MDKNAISEVIIEFERKLSNALEFRYRREDESIKQEIISNHNISRFDIMNFLNKYLISSYPEERLVKIIHMLIEIKLQMYLIEIELGADNTLTQLTSSEIDSNNKETHVELIHLNSNQNLIFKSRALWERLMNVVYFLETGKELSATSKKTKFFNYINNDEDGVTKKWRFLSDYKEYVEWFDNSWRTPETHGGSTLKSAFIGSGMTSDDINKILGLNNIVANVFYVNLMDIIAGNKASRWFWTYGMGPDKLTIRDSTKE